MLLAVALPGVAVGNTLWLETELFGNLGGWINDAQFVDQMGSPYLLAIGLEGSVPDAVTTVSVPAAGKYRLWVRTRDWLPEFSPGRFQIAIGGKTVDHVFGQGKAKGWVWEDGGVCELAAGSTEVRLHDLTGHYSRCDAVVLTSDDGYRPPDDREGIAAARIRFGGVSREEKRLAPYDTVVVGGGLAGAFAAVASARGGARTALIQNRPVLGGNGSTEVLVKPQGDTTREPLDPGEGGIIEEVRTDAVEAYSERMLRVCKAEPKLDLFFNTHATGVEMSAKHTIAAIKALDVTTKQRLVFPGTTFIDCTGDGEIGVWAGAEYRHGREPRSMYNETRAPEQADGHTMGGTLRYVTQLQADPVPFKAPDWAHKFPQCSDFGINRHPQLLFGGWQWVIEYGGMGNTYDDSEEIRDELVRIIWGMWDHAKNHCSRLHSEADRYKLTWVSHVVGKRESRRLIGDYVMTEQDIAAAKLFPDRVSYAGWGIDIHPPGGFYDTEPPATFSHKLKFSVPFRSLYTKDIDNLMMAGRCISVSHVALGATRVMITCGLQGQAVGTAAALCKNHRIQPRGIYQNYVADLQQQLLKDGCYIIDLPNTDPHDLARQATASASSTSPPIVIPHSAKGSVHALSCERAVMFRTTKDRIGRIALYLESNNRKPTTIQLGLRRAERLGEFSETKDLAVAQATVPAKVKGWICFELNAAIKPGFYYGWLPKTEGVSWRLSDPTPPDTMRAYFNKEWHVSGEAYRFQIDPESVATLEKNEPEAAAPPPANMFDAANVIDGYARAVRGVPHSWRPAPDQPLPQWVQLDFGKSVAFNTVHVSFQSQEMRGEDFQLQVCEGANWRTVASVTANEDRRRVLAFNRVTAAKLRLVIGKGRSAMGVCELRAYDETDGEK